MKFSTAKILMLVLLLTALAVTVGALLLLDEGTDEYLMSEIVSLALLASGIAVGAIWGRCPNCGKHLFVKLLQLKACPHCRRPLDPNGKYISANGRLRH